MHIICPLCQAPLKRQQKHWQCINNHHFDIARQGYTHLLPVQHKKSRSPGDDANMVKARSHFLDQGFYQPISDAINHIVANYSQTIDEPVIIDTGCGDGYYTDRLMHALDQRAEVAGFDISKFAIRAATRRNKTIAWFVANSNALPVADHSCDIVLSLFAPVQVEEFKRVLKPNGRLLIAGTSQHHLLELRRLLYENLREKPAAATNPLRDSFNIETCRTLNKRITLPDNDAITQLVSMTPHFWRAKPERKASLQALEKLSLTLDIKLEWFKPNSPNNTTA